VELEVFNILSAGGDMATAFIAYAIWKLDRRVYALEMRADEK
jgi:hypothetical protein